MNGPDPQLPDTNGRFGARQFNHGRSFSNGAEYRFIMKDGGKRIIEVM
jgi:hypothetical protein